MKNIHLSATSDLVRMVSEVIHYFSKKARRMGRAANLKRVFQSPRIVVNKEEAEIEKIVEAFGRVEGGEQFRGGDKIKGQ